MVWSLGATGASAAGVKAAAATGVKAASVGKVAGTGKAAGADTIRQAAINGTKGKPTITPPGGDKSGGIKPPDKLNKPGVGDQAAKAKSDLQILHAVQQKSGLSDAEIRAADQLYQGRFTLKPTQQEDILKQFSPDRHGPIQNAVKEIGDQKFLKDVKDAAEQAQKQAHQGVKPLGQRFRDLATELWKHEWTYSLTNMSRAGKEAEGSTRGFMNVMHAMLAA